MNKKNEGQKIGCTVSECMHNNINDCTCRLDAISVCPCSANITKDPLKDTACGSYEYANVQHKERY